MISDDSLLTIVLLLLVPQHRHADAAGVVRLGEQIDLGELGLAVDRVAGRAVGLSKVQPFSPMSGETIDIEMTFSRPLSLRKMTVRCAQGQASET